MVMLMLYGLSVLQTYMYFLKYENDGAVMKAMVLVLWMLGTTHATFVCHTVYHYLVLSYTNPLSLIDGEWSVYAATCVGVVSCFIVQIFFARMIYHLTTHMWRLVLTTVFTILILGQVAFGVELSVKLFQIWQLPKLKAAVYVAMVPLFTIRVVSDAVTASTLCFTLYKTRPSQPRSIRLVNTLIVYAINRFVLTTVVVVVQTIILIVRPDSIWAMVIEFVSVHLYVNSLLATLNSRSHLRNMGTDYISTARFSGFAVRGGSSRHATSTTDPRVLDVSRDARPLNVGLKRDATSSETQDLELADLDGKRNAGD